MTKMLNIAVHNRSNLDLFTEYFDFNNIPYSRIELICTVAPLDKQFLLPCDSSKQLIIVDTITFLDILSCDMSYNYLLKYINNGNTIWVGDQTDTTICLHKSIDHIQKLDSVVPKYSIVLWMDAEPLSPMGFSNIVLEYNLYTFVSLPRIKNTVFTKNKQSYDFLITTILKEGREHRDILLTSLQNRSFFSQNCLTHFTHESKKEKYKDYIGDTPTHHTCNHIFPSMDLYSHSFVEVVPETCFNDYHFLTEKTIKPIATKTPFLMCTTQGYLRFLQKLGFQTFDSLIDESYDKEIDLTCRIEKMLDSLEYIIKNNAADFYNSSKNILDHNYNKLCELSTKRQSIFDHAVHAQLNCAKQYSANS